MSETVKYTFWQFSEAEILYFKKKFYKYSIFTTLLLTHTVAKNPYQFCYLLIYLIIEFLAEVFNYLQNVGGSEEQR